MVSHREVFAALVQREGWTRGAELGLGAGHLFRRLLWQCPDLFLIGVDHFVKPAWRPRIEAIAAEYAGRCQVYGCTTVEAAPQVPDRSLDFVFVDAGHSYEAVRDDLRLWRRKVKPGGWLGGHDYHQAHPGVIRAVNDAFERPQALPGWIWWVPA